MKTTMVGPIIPAAAIPDKESEANAFSGYGSDYGKCLLTGRLARRFDEFCKKQLFFKCL